MEPNLIYATHKELTGDQEFRGINGHQNSGSTVRDLTISFSVILCVNRDQPWLSEAIDSILTQDDPDFEFLIAANACSDELWDKLVSLGNNDSRIRLFRSNIGQLSFNLNLLADKAHGEYLVRMDADDVSESHRLRTLRLALKKEQVDILGSSVVLIDGDGIEVGAMQLPESCVEIRGALLTRTALCHPSVAIRRRFLLDMRGYLGGYVSEDTDLWLRALRADARMKNLPNSLLRYRVHENQSIASPLGYAEVASHWLRELLITPSWYATKGLTVALIKAIFAKMLPGIGRYRKSKGKSQG